LPSALERRLADDGDARGEDQAEHQAWSGMRISTGIDAAPWRLERQAWCA
jgi:hypothetical protein